MTANLTTLPYFSFLKPLYIHLLIYKLQIIMDRWSHCVNHKCTWHLTCIGTFYLYLTLRRPYINHMLILHSKVTVPYAVCMHVVPTCHFHHLSSTPKETGFPPVFCSIKQTLHIHSIFHVLIRPKNI